MPSTHSAIIDRFAKPILQVGFGFLAVVVYVLLIICVKAWAYPGWTWRGYVTDMRAILGLLVFLTPVASWLWVVYRGTKPAGSLTAAAGKLLPGTLLPESVAVLATAALILGSLLYAIGERPVGGDYLQLASSSNWSHAEKELNRLSSQPLRSPLLESLQLHLDIHRESERGTLSSSLNLRESRHRVQMLLERKIDPLSLNTLTYSELSKAIHLVEDPRNDQSSLNEGIRVLHERLFGEVSAGRRAVVTARLGEVELAAKHYHRARLWFEWALEEEQDPLRRARLHAHLGNTYAGVGSFAVALHRYSQAEKWYPEGRRAIFYSNFAYLLLAAGQPSEARQKINQALRVDPADWYSYLNRGLISEALSQFDDAILDYDQVIKNSDNPDSVREAQIFLGRCAELSGRPESEYIPFYLQASGRSDSLQSISDMLASPDQMANLYLEMAQLLSDTNTHAIESYIHWFSQRAEAIVGSGAG